MLWVLQNGRRGDVSQLNENWNLLLADFDFSTAVAIGFKSHQAPQEIIDTLNSRILYVVKLDYQIWVTPFSDLFFDDSKSVEQELLSLQGIFVRDGHNS